MIRIKEEDWDISGNIEVITTRYGSSGSQRGNPIFIYTLKTSLRMLVLQPDLRRLPRVGMWLYI